jgi:N-acetylmuramoyl-L-alanine amidase
MGPPAWWSSCANSQQDAGLGVEASTAHTTQASNQHAFAEADAQLTLAAGGASSQHPDNSPPNPQPMPKPQPAPAPGMGRTIATDACHAGLQDPAQIDTSGRR